MTSPLARRIARRILTPRDVRYIADGAPAEDIATPHATEGGSWDGPEGSFYRCEKAGVIVSTEPFGDGERATWAEIVAVTREATEPTAADVLRAAAKRHAAAFHARSDHIGPNGQTSNWNPRVQRDPADQAVLDRLTEDVQQAWREEREAAAAILARIVDDPNQLDLLGWLEEQRQTAGGAS